MHSDAVEAAATSSAGKIIAGQSVRVSSDLPRVQHGEVFLAVNPLRPSELIACSIILDRHRPNMWISERDAAYISKDSGAHWHLAMISGDSASDPSCAFGRNGHAYMLANMGGGNPLGKGIPTEPGDWIYESVDDGAHWKLVDRLQTGSGRASSRDISFVDNEIMLGNAPAPYNIAIEGDLLQLKRPGIDLGKGPAFFASTTHDPTLRRLAYFRTSSGRFTFSTAAFLPSGNLAVADASGRKASREEMKRGQYTASNLPGNPSGSVYYREASAMPGRFLYQSRVSGYYSDQKTTCSPSIATDTFHGSPFFGSIYIGWCDARLGHYSIFLAYSRDRGRSWSRPMILDASATHDFVATNFDPTVAVNSRGVVAVFWYDRTEHQRDLGWDIAFRASNTGGSSWLPATRIPGAKTLWSPARVNSNNLSVNTIGGLSLNVELGFHGDAFHAGDYSGMIADRDGVFHPLWIDNHSGNVPQLWTTTVRVDGPVTVVHRPVQTTVFHPAREQLPQSIFLSGPRSKGIKVASLSRDLHDVTAETLIDTRDVSYEAATRRIGFTVLIRNRSHVSLRCPLYFQIDSKEQHLPTDSQPLNAGIVTGKSGPYLWLVKSCHGSVPSGATVSIPIKVQLINVQFVAPTEADAHDPYNAHRTGNDVLVQWNGVHVLEKRNPTSKLRMDGNG